MSLPPGRPKAGETPLGGVARSAGVPGMSLPPGRPKADDTSPGGVAPAATAFDWPVRVYWEDTDGGGIVYYANYLKFFERARTEWLRAMDVSQAVLAESPGLMFVVSAVNLRYHAPARLDDMLQLRLRVAELGAARITLTQQAWRASGTSALPLAEATVHVGCVQAASLRPTRIPSDLRAKIAGWLTPDPDCAPRSGG